MLKEGDKAPGFTLPNQDGKDISLNDHSGKWVILYFYPKDNTSGCTKEACDFTEKRNEYEGLGAVVIGISPDSIASHERFINKHGIEIELLSDPEKEVLKAYGAWGEKRNYGRVYEGVIRSTFLISPQGRIRRIWKNVKVRTKRKGEEVRHADIVGKALRELKG